MTMILVESFDLEHLREFECMVCLEKAPVLLGEKWQVCANFHFTKTKTICANRSDDWPCFSYAASATMTVMRTF
jgi:hypothetical protein